MSPHAENCNTYMCCNNPSTLSSHVASFGHLSGSESDLDKLVHWQACIDPFASQAREPSQMYNGASRLHQVMTAYDPIITTLQFVMAMTLLRLSHMDGSHTQTRAPLKAGLEGT
jgi:hypothetical protein